MQGRLKIENFGPIKKVDIQLNKLVVFIGPQSGGKSTIAKLIAIFKDVNFIVNAFQEPEENHFNKYLTNFGISDYTEKDSVIEYVSEVYNVSFKKGKASVELKPEFSDLLKIIAKGQKLMKFKLGDENNFIPDFESKPDAGATNYLNSYIFHSIYIPAERMLFSTLSESLYSLLSNDIALPKSFLQFGSIIERVRGHSSKDNFDFLSVTYLRENNQDWILQNGKKIKLSHASSGIQASMPLLLAINKEYEVDYLKTFIVEEPELNLYPSTQKDLVAFLAERCTKKNNSLLVTTHSPYVLSAFANLIKANEVAKLSDAQKAKVTKVLPSKYWIDYNDTSAYYIDKGVSKSIMDKKFKTIDFSQIDKASDLIGREFNKLLDIEFED